MDSSDGLDIECNFLPVKKKRRVESKCIFCVLKGSDRRDKVIVGTKQGESKILQICDNKLEIDKNDSFCSQLKIKVARPQIPIYNGTVFVTKHSQSNQKVENTQKTKVVQHMIEKL